jgi:hypothetical protein
MRNFPTNERMKKHGLGLMRAFRNEPFGGSRRISLKSIETNRIR